MGQHGAKSNIADALDAARGCIVMVIYNNATLAININANSLEVQPLGVRAASDGDEKNIGVKLADTYQISI